MRQFSGTQYDRMTETSIIPLILQLSVPTILTMMVTNIYNMADTAFVGRLGTSASAAVGVVFGYMQIIQALGCLFGMGSGSIISRMLGHKDNEKASIVASTGFFMSLCSGFMLTLISIVMLDALLDLLGSTETIAYYAKIYICYILAAAPIMTANFTLNQILRYEGKAAFGMIGITAGCIINIFGDPVLMFIFDMGIAGAGLSTALSQTISFLILLSFFLRGKSLCRLSWKMASFRKKQMGDIFVTGLPSLLRQGLTSVNIMVLNGQAAIYGDAAIAAMSIVNRVINFIFSIALGMGQGFQPISGFNFGAGKYDRVRKAFAITAVMAEILIGIAAFIVVFRADALIGIFRDDQEVISIGTRALRIQGISLLFLPISMMTEMLFQSTGQKLGAIILSSLRGGLIFIPAVLILVYFRGLMGLQEAQAVAFVGACPISIAFLCRLMKRMQRSEKIKLKK